jgi:hypothetical protein
MYGKITPDEMGDFCHGKPQKNPLETALIWKSDIDLAIISLSDRKHGWRDALQDGMSDSMILHLCRSNEVGSMQRTVINQCILKDCLKTCKETGTRGSKVCWNEGIISRMRRYLNKQWLDEHGRDQAGRFREVKT